MVHSVNVGAFVIPTSEHRLDRTEELFLRITREIGSDLSLVFGFELTCQSLEVVGGKFGIERNAFLLFHLVYQSFKVLFADFHNDVGVHLYKSSVAVPSPSRITRFFDKNFENFFVQTEVKNGIHHTRHRRSCARTDGNKKRIFFIAEFLSGNLFEFLDVFHYFRHNVVGNSSAVVVITGTSFGCYRKAVRNGQAEIGHFGEVCAFSAQKLAHLAVAFAKLINVFHL